MSPNLGQRDCRRCGGDVIRDPNTYRVTAFVSHIGMQVAHAECSNCGARYTAWVGPTNEPEVGGGPAYGAREAEQQLIQEFGFYDLSYRSTFSDEPGPEDLPQDRCPNCGKVACWQYGGERGEAGPFLVCHDCGYDGEEVKQISAATDKLNASLDRINDQLARDRQLGVHTTIDFPREAFPVCSKIHVELGQLFADAGWSEIYYACATANALSEKNGAMAAHYATQLRALPESRMKAMVIAKLNTIMDKLFENR